MTLLIVWSPVSIDNVALQENFCTEEKKMKNDTTKNNTATSLELNDLDMVSGGFSLGQIFDNIGKIADVTTDIIDWIID